MILLVVNFFCRLWPFTIFIVFSSLSLIFEELFLIVSGLDNWYQDCQGGRIRERDHFIGIEDMLEERDKELFEGI